MDAYDQEAISIQAKLDLEKQFLEEKKRDLQQTLEHYTLILEEMKKNEQQQEGPWNPGFVGLGLTNRVNRLAKMAR